MLRTVRPADASSLWDVRLAWHEKVVLFVLRQGVLPRHVAVVADGSRRYAKTAGMKLGEAYDILFQNLVSFCFWMERLGVTHLSSFILSCRNFRRATCELDAALDKLLYFFATTLNSLRFLSRLGLWLRHIGDLTWLPRTIQTRVAEVDVCTSGSSRTITWAIAAAYNTRHNAKLMIMDFAKAVKDGVIQSNSGEVRFSEFLVLQNGYAYIYIDPTLWPVVGFWNLVCAIFMFQLHWPKIKVVKQRHRNLSTMDKDGLDSTRALRQRNFLRCNEMARKTCLAKLSLSP
ncbi:dehydrodolichyl diphosphate synthase complex subunit DHDDS-like isoform X2 [Amblyomma americanum]